MTTKTAEDGTAAVANVRPMPCVRAPSELVSVTAAVLTREVHDARYRCLRLGVQVAVNWVLGFTDRTPVDNAVLLRPSFAEIVEEYGRAAQASSGVRRLEKTGWSDAGRITGRGVELFLLWYAFADVPTPPVLDSKATLRTIMESLGDVGCDAPGLHGPQVSRLRFPELPGARLQVGEDGTLLTV